MSDKLVIPLPQDAWRLVTDGVMGGVSRGVVQVGERDGRACINLSGRVSTDNNGGFIQAALDVDKADAERLSDFAGVRIDVIGNGETYNVHLRSSDLWLPWQSFRATFEATPQWRTLHLPFDTFSAYKTGSALRAERIRRLGVVAIGRDFDADLCIAGAAFYRSAP